MRTITILRTCLEDVGPKPDKPEALGTVDNSIDPDCNPRFELCADPAAAGRLVRWVAAADRWMKAVETSCQKENDDERN